MANESRCCFDAFIWESSTPPALEKVAFWFEGFKESTPEKPPSSHSSEFNDSDLEPEKEPPPIENHLQSTPETVGSPATARPTDELNEHSVAASSIHDRPSSEHCHFSYAHGGNLGASREGTFGSMTIKPCESYRPKITPAFAGNAPTSKFGASSDCEPSTPAHTPFVAPTAAEMPSESRSDRHSRRRSWFRKWWTKAGRNRIRESEVE